MKQTIVLIAALTISMAGFSQKQAKPKINKANTARENGELAEAKSIIDAATTYEKTKDDGKTWYYRGLIYATIDTTSNAAFADLKPNALEIAMESFEKAEELGDPDKAYFITNAVGLPIPQSQQIDLYYSHYFNKAVEQFQNNEFEDAVASFNRSATIMKGDTNSYKNAAYAAHNGELFDLAKENYRKAIDSGARSLDMYTNLMNIYLVADQDNEAALEIVTEARKVYPTNPDLSKNEINLLIKLDRVEAAKDNLIAAIADEPENTTLLFTLAAMYEELGQEAEALKAYNQAIAVDPNHFESNFNKGVILLNSANEVIKEYSNLGVSAADRKKEKELEPLIQTKLKEALPQWQKLHEIKPKDRQVAETLAYIYGRLRMYKEQEALMDIIDAMPAAE